MSERNQKQKIVLEIMMQLETSHDLLNNEVFEKSYVETIQMKIEEAHTLVSKLLIK